MTLVTFPSSTGRSLLSLHKTWLPNDLREFGSNATSICVLEHKDLGGDSTDNTGLPQNTILQNMAIYIYLNSIDIVYTTYTYIYFFHMGMHEYCVPRPWGLTRGVAAHPCRTVKNLTTHTINIHTHNMWTWKPNWTWMPTPSKLVFNPTFDLLKVYHSFLPCSQFLRALGFPRTPAFSDGCILSLQNWGRPGCWERCQK